MTKTICPGMELESLDETLIDDLLATPDADFIAEVTEIGRDPHATANRVRAVLEQGCVLAAKAKLKIAQAAVATTRAKAAHVPFKLDASRARQLLKDLSANDPEFQRQITLAARNEGELSDEDILGIFEDLIELGVFPRGMISGD